MTKKRPRRTFSREFKIEAVKMVTEQGYSLNQVGRDLDIDPKMLRRWRHELSTEEAEAFPGKGMLSPEQEQMRAMQRKIERLEMERDILKKAVAIFSEPQIP